MTLTVYRSGQYIEVELTFDTQPQTTGSDDSSQSSDNSYGYGNGGNSAYTTHSGFFLSLFYHLNYPPAGEW